MTLGRLKQNSCCQHLTISILFVLNIFINNLLITKSIEDICDLLSKSQNGAKITERDGDAE